MSIYNRIITNAHVIANATTVTITNSKGETYEATILGSDTYADIAVLSTAANNVDVEKISQRIKDRKERRKRKKMIEAGINPTFISSKDNDNNMDILIR